MFVVSKACEHHAAVAHYMTKESSVLLGDVHLPKCNDEDGSFSQVQCNSMGRSCWCVDEAGREIPSTRTKFGQQPKCTGSVQILQFIHNVKTSLLKQSLKVKLFPRTHQTMCSIGKLQSYLYFGL